ncbi:MAG: tRNA-(ms[2]io[6]A)-hydroxylase [Natronospirillum sp.]|uniref:tRNA-(ms[2]io[6]A)-hydroxylase n=1 Tax=Natronospirillum sp. TaxID=2812955 RepID=UPI0025EF6247|nr:tRNA-(ms[2]io[6]A)-hydroxylase [Natronospirillum sp.]MCH8552785.1 tRNA-(ms[2]io[6]A)-hydroxylase [Natronospirillum sp.]
MSAEQELVQPVNDFLGGPTPEAWVKWALQNPETLLIDHAHCEKKAASTALSMMYRYVDDSAFLSRLSKLAREELVHFEQVMRLMKKRGIAYDHLTAAPYASGLLAVTRKEEPGRLIDRLIVSAFIEARSCERFAAIAPCLDRELADFYRGLLQSEARHFEIYLQQAAAVIQRSGLPESSLEERVEMFRQQELELIQAPAAEFRFHSGVPSEASSAV